MTSPVAIIKGAYSLITGPWASPSKPSLCLWSPFSIRGQTIRMPHGSGATPSLSATMRMPDRTKCIVCMTCIKACPSGTIKKIEGEKKEGEKKKTCTEYILDFSTCSQCGICVEVCPVDALAFSADYNLAVYSRAECEFDLVKEYEKRK